MISTEVLPNIPCCDTSPKLAALTPNSQELSYWDNSNILAMCQEMSNDVTKMLLVWNIEKKPLIESLFT
jgi:hypothetical protein